jgi:pyrroline-5-carboxylate reductase
MSLDDVSIILVGAGNMGGALLGGWLKNDVQPSQIKVLDPNPPVAMVKMLAKKSVVHESRADNLEAPDVLLIAVKPQVMDSVLQSVKHLVGKNTVSISVAAGKTLSVMQRNLETPVVVRAMPNTPALVQRGITVACASVQVSQLQKQHTTALLSATGSVEWVKDEALMDAVTAVSGSGPAYVFHLVEALGNAAIDAGLPEELGRKLALETVAGAGELMMQSDLPPSTLRENVTSPGGTTQAALSVLMGEGGFPDLLKRAVDAAAKRSRELM